MKSRWFETLLVAVAALVFVICIWQVMGLRPIHHDEANQAYSARRLLDFYGYKFNPVDHHGPTLYFLTLPVAWLRGVFYGRELDLATVRLVPLLAAAAVLCVPVLLWPSRLGRGTCAMTALLLCFSPCFAFYSHYYVQEMLLVCFLLAFFCCFLRWLEGHQRGWCVAMGCMAGLCVATKETWILNAFAAGVGVAGVLVVQRRKPREVWQGISWREVGVAALSAAVVIVVLFSSFGTYWRGVVDFFICWKYYLVRGTSGNTQFAAPFTRFAEWLFWFQKGNGMPRWSEWLILLGVVLAVVQVFWRRIRPRGIGYDLLVFQLVYAVTLFLVYSGISYKTPWCALSLLQPLALAGGMGWAGLVWHDSPQVGRLSAALFGAACMAILPLCRQTVGRYCADPRNPWAYAQTVRDYQRLPERISRYCELSGARPHIVIMTDYVNQWPLPWFMHETDWADFMNLRKEDGEEERESRKAAKMRQEPEFVLGDADLQTERLPGHERYVWEDLTLRPNVLLRLGTRRDVFKRLVQ